MTEMMKACVFCGEMVREKALKCRHCGELLEEMKVEREEPPPRRKMSRWLIALIASLVAVPVIVIVVVFYMLPGSRPYQKEPENYGEKACRQVAQAQQTFHEVHEYYATLEELAKRGLIDKGLLKGEHRGYRFEFAVDETGEEWWIRAWPLTPGPETKSYYIDTTGDMCTASYTSHSDEKAGPDSAPEWDDWDIGD